MMVEVLSCQEHHVLAEVLAGKLGTVADAQEQVFGKKADVCRLLWSHLESQILIVSEKQQLEK